MAAENINNTCCFEAAYIFDDQIPVLICDTRMSDKDIPDEYEVFQLRGSDNDPGMPATIEKIVEINWCGSVIALRSDKIADKIAEKGYAVLEDTLNYAADFVTFSTHFKDDGENWIYRNTKGE